VRIGRAAGVTDTGRRRLRNEDAFVCEPPLFAVADGMGGARAGETAARLAAAVLEESHDTPDGQEGLVALIVEANRRIWEQALADPTKAGMGTTVTAALVLSGDGTVAVGHVGDSRAYRWRNDALEQLTTDHSLVAELVSSGVLTPEEAERHPQRSAITRALGTEPEVEVETFTVAGEPGDLFLLCSDGLSTMVSDEGVAEAIRSADGDPATTAEALVAVANARGGEDNVTVVLFELEEGEESEMDDEIPVDLPAALDEEAPGEEVPGAVARDEEAIVPDSDLAQPEDAEVSRHGAGAGGRLAALALIAAVALIALLALYWSLGR
jgi:serine/threonine protein phosphatase PrpC